MRLWQGLVLAILGVAATATAEPAKSADFKVVVHPSVQVTTISTKELSKVFLKKEIKWESGAAILPVDLPADSPVREAFSKAIHDKKTSAVKAWWQQRIFSGQGSPPPEKANDAEVLAYVAANPGAIGYVGSSTATTGVKVVEVK